MRLFSLRYRAFLSRGSGVPLFRLILGRMAWNQAAFSRRLNQLLDARGWTQQQLATAIHTHRRNVSRWQSNPQNRPSFDQIEAMAAALRVSPGFLAFGEGANASEQALLAKWRRLTPRRKQIVQDIVEELVGGL